MKRFLSLLLLTAAISAPIGAARNFNGTTDLMSAASTPPVTGVPATMCGFFRVASVAAVRTILAVGHGANADYMSVYTRTNSTLRADTGDGTNFASPTTVATVSLNTWHHACAVFAANNDRSIYLDGGNKVSETATTVTLSTLDRSRIGVSYIDTSPFSGDLAEVAFWNAALTDAEVASLAKGFSPTMVRPMSLRSYYPLSGRGTERDLYARSFLATTGTTAATTHPRMFFSF
jgi:hypothetical protein